RALALPGGTSLTAGVLLAQAIAEARRGFRRARCLGITTARRGRGLLGLDGKDLREGFGQAGHAGAPTSRHAQTLPIRSGPHPFRCNPDLPPGLASRFRSGAAAAEGVAVAFGALGSELGHGAEVLGAVDLEVLQGLG